MKSILTGSFEGAIRPLVFLLLISTVILPCQSKAAQQQASPAKDSTSRVPPAAVCELETRANQVAAGVPVVQEMLETVNGKLKAFKASAQTLQELRLTHDQLREQVLKTEAEITTAEAALTTTNENTPFLPIDQLREKFEQCKRQREKLAAEEARLLGLLEDSKKKPALPVAVEVDKKPILFAISRNLVATLDAPYFQTKVGHLSSGARAAQISPAKDGEPVGEAIAPGGLLQKALAKADSSREYVAFLLASDSIDAFYAAVKELRKSKFQYTWGPWSGKPIVIKLDGLSSSSAGPGIVFN
jgi:hypothetical protein